MKLSNKAYDTIKWIVTIVVPAVTVCYCALAKVWGWPYAGEIAQTSAAVCTMLGAILKISEAEYNKTIKPE